MESATKRNSAVDPVRATEGSGEASLADHARSQVLNQPPPAPVQAPQDQTAIETRAGNYCPACYHQCDRCSHCDKSLPAPVQALITQWREFADRTRDAERRLPVGIGMDETRARMRGMADQATSDADQLAGIYPSTKEKS